MKNIFHALLYSLVIFLFLFSGGAVTGQDAQPESDAGATEQPEWTNLLDAELSQWETFIGVPHKTVEIPGREPSESINGINGGSPIGLADPLNVFSAEVVDGEPVLKITGQIYGGLTTLKEYESYHLSLQFRWGEKKWEPRLEKLRDSGLLIHCVGDHGKFWNVWMQSLECQIQEGDCGDFIGLGGTEAVIPVGKTGNRTTYHQDHTGYQLIDRMISHGPSEEMEHGQWNTVEVYTIGQKTVFAVNGTPNMVLLETKQSVNREVQPLTRGKIQIQSEAAELEYRRIKIRPITAFPEHLLPLIADPPPEQMPKPNGGYDPTIPMPTQMNVRYGQTNRNRLDFWKADSDSPTPLVFAIHGGGWRGGNSRQTLHRILDTTKLLENGISVVSTHYRLINDQNETEPPVKLSLEDAARALQFVRGKAEEWNIDKNRIAGAGESAGGSSALWLAYSDDMADPNNEDPLRRESTRLVCVAVDRPQTTLDPHQMKQWITNSNYGEHAFGFADFEEFYQARDEIKPWIDRYSPYSLLTEDDPPTFMQFSRGPAEDRVERDPTHSAWFGIELKSRCDSLGVECGLVYPRSERTPGDPATTTDFLIRMLKPEAESNRAEEQASSDK